MKRPKEGVRPAVANVPPMERRPVAIRAYVDFPNARRGFTQPRKPNNFRPEWTLFFDVETTTDPAQRLRFGAYEVRKLGARREKGLLYDPRAVSKEEERALKTFAKAESYKLRTIEDFIEIVFYRVGYFRRGMIVGFNLPFDISRLAIDHGKARGREGRDMMGAFTFKLSRNDHRARIQIKHHSQRDAFIGFAATAGQRDARSERNREDRAPAWRGAFVDVKTIGAAQTGSSHTLDSLAELLGVARKLKHPNHGGPIDARYIRYCVQDVKATRECFFKLQAQYDTHGLIDTPINKIHSEASLGKAYFKQMGVLPWQLVQRDFPNSLTGAILCSYYGGRSEVRWRRIVRSGLYCDFHSMYPTVCTNMGLWRFMIANGMTWRESADEIRELLRNLKLSDLHKREFWTRLTTLVRVEPAADIFPVRAQYVSDPQYTIGLNYVTSNIPFWFTLADCIVSTLLTGRPPKIIRALTFAPKAIQYGLRPVSIMGNEDFRIDPRVDDFPKRLIELRTIVKQQMKDASGAQRARLDAEQLGLKILANATTYGVFVELNPENLGEMKTLQCFGGDAIGFPVRAKKFEHPGRFFHPLLATLITGAARLMLAIAEKLVVDEGLDWILCDTDSMMIGQPSGMADEEFRRRAKVVRDWFQPLSPYDVPVELFKLEDENFKIGEKETLDKLHCYAVSAKRYVLFNKDENGEPVVRRASGHGLGALRKPYDDNPDQPDIPRPPRSFPKPRVKLKGVARWQHDYWRNVAKLALEGRDNEANGAHHPIFDRPAASGYHATKPAMLRWFDAYNKHKPYEQQVRPFGFLLTYQPAPLYSLTESPRGGKRPFRPTTPYDANIEKALRHCFDRNDPERRGPISLTDLRTHRQLLADYHMHDEAKFHNARGSDRGETLRRHVFFELADLHYIGKESNDWEEQFYLGMDEDAQQIYGSIPAAVARLLEEVKAADRKYGRRTLAHASGMSARYLSAIISGAAKNPSARKLAKLKRGIALLEAAEREQAAREQKCVGWLREECEGMPLGELAVRLGYDPKNLRKVIKGLRAPSKLLLGRIDALRAP